jgi:quinol monooxygenase YgiN
LGKRRLIPLSMFVFLLVAALSSFAGPAGAQPDQRQYVVTYVEFKPADTKTGGRVLDDLAAQGRASVGVIRFDVLQQVDRRNFFALFEIWSSAQTFEAFKSASATQAILTQLARFMHEDTRWTPKAAAVDSGGTVWALDMPTRRRFAQGASDCHPRALRKDGAVGLDIETSPGVDQA